MTNGEFRASGLLADAAATLLRYAIVLTTQPGTSCYPASAPISASLCQTQGWPPSSVPCTTRGFLRNTMYRQSVCVVSVPCSATSAKANSNATGQAASPKRQGLQTPGPRPGAPRNTQDGVLPAPAIGKTLTFTCPLPLTVWLAPLQRQLHPSFSTPRADPQR